MLRLAALVVVVLVEMGIAHAGFGAVPPNVKFAGQTTIGSIDMNDNGVPDEPEDCNFSAFADGSALQVNGTQTGANKARPCLGRCVGSGFVSVDFAETIINDCDWGIHSPGAPFVPLVADFCSTLASCQSGSAPVAHAGQAPTPLQITAGLITRITTSTVAGFGQLCTAGGPAVEITTDRGVKVVRNLFAYPNASNPTHMCASDYPVQLESGEIVNRTACFPVADGSTPISIGDEPPLVIIALDALPDARGARRADDEPVGLIGDAVAADARRVGIVRRRGFAEALRLP
jgi:hypothetical protein